ncbi:Cytochrome P450 [Dillenia turbinata]|uniref:Cytochrome P450 n=1 Tax=Dillenia turbinata TaxID=194707 RepID=A0AAN8VP25_9MAGN
MELWSSLLCLLLICTLIQTLLSVSKSSKSKRLPPGPIPYPIVGNLLELGNKPHKSLAQLAKVHGPVMSLKLGQITTVVISSAPMAREILQIQDLCFSSRTIPESIKAHNHDQFSVAWLPSTTQWRNLRKISNTHIFTTQKLDANQHLRRKKIEELLAHVQKCCEAGHAVDIGKAAFMTTLNLLSNTVFSVDLVNPNSDAAQEFKSIFWGIMEEAGKPNLADFFPVLKKIDPQGIRRKMSYHFGKMFQIFDKFIDERLESRKTSGSVANVDVLDILLNLNQESQEIDMTHIKHLLLDLLVAGTDTSSNTLEWAMAEILCSPETLSRVQAELNQIINVKIQILN